MRREIDVMAHRMVTEYDKTDFLLSTLEFRASAAARWVDVQAFLQGPL